jgi:thiol-disulfide isomerase/thioredoxin
MKKILVLSVLITTAFGCKPSTKISKNAYELNVKAEGIFDGMRAYLNLNNDGRNPIVTDTAIVFNEVFNFRGQIEGAEMRTLTIDGLRGQVSFVLEAGGLQGVVYKDSIQKSTVTGTYNNAVFNDYKQQYLQKIEALNSLSISLRDANTTAVLSKSIQFKIDSLRGTFNTFGFDFIKANPSADFSLILLENAVSQKGFDQVLAAEAYDRIDSTIKAKTTTNQTLSNRINTKISANKRTKGPVIGEKAPNFSAPNPLGKQIELEKIKGKVTLIDFWASWCKPCRIENPSLVRLYKEYHSKGLEIISVSLDRESQKQFWIKAIEKDQLNWYNVSNLKFWQDPIAQLYGVNSIPATFIIDAKGVLIAKRLRGQQLEQKIKELLD